MKTRFELNQLDNGNWNAIDTAGNRVLIAVNVTLEAAEIACAKRRNETEAAFDEKREHEKDLEYESRVDYDSWLTDEEMGDE